MKIIKSVAVVIIFSFTCLLNLGCTANEPPLEFTPSPEIIEKALTIQLNRQYAQISEQLKTPTPQFKITKINVKTIKPTIKIKLPTYHLEGNYQIILQLNKSKRKKITNNFQLDLQRQSAGKTWRIIITKNDHQSLKYYSYKIE